MAGAPINLEEIAKLSEQELKTYFSQWLHKDENVARKMQAKLRKDLIEDFSKTTLGRKINFQHSKCHRIILSPLILVLNTIVAEFLYAQNCHFTLSVFCAEIPYRNMIPDFENIKNFRFNESEINDILDAINMKLPSKLKNDICESYLKNESLNCPTMMSLLYIILNYILEISENKLITENEKQHLDSNPRSQKTVDKEVQTRTNNAETKSNSSSSKQNHRFLNNYLLILSKKIKEMSFSMKKLERNCNNSDSKNTKYEQLNKSLEKISELIKLFSISQKKNRKTSAIAIAVNEVAKQFGKCAENFENILKTDKISQRHDNYNDYLDELQSSSFGRKFINKIETTLQKTLDTEKEKFRNEYEVKLKLEKEAIKAEYEEKYLKFKNSTAETVESSADKNVEDKLHEIRKRHNELLKIFTKTESMMKNSIREKLEENKSYAITQNKNKIEQTKLCHQTKEISPIKVFQKISPNFHEMTHSIVQQERKIDRILFDAKLLIKDLENESHNLDKSFQEHMNNIITERNQADENTTEIWKNYNLDKNILNSKNNQLKRNISDEIKSLKTIQKITEEETLANIPKTSEEEKHIDIPKIIVEEPVVPSFANPFRKLREQIVSLEEISNKNDKQNVGTPTMLLRNFLQNQIDTQLDMIDVKPRIKNSSHVKRRLFQENMNTNQRNESDKDIKNDGEERANKLEIKNDSLLNDVLTNLSI